MVHFFEGSWIDNSRSSAKMYRSDGIRGSTRHALVINLDDPHLVLDLRDEPHLPHSNPAYKTSTAQHTLDGGA